jgi:hypothetical protein
MKHRSIRFNSFLLLALPIGLSCVSLPLIAEEAAAGALSERPWSTVVGIYHWGGRRASGLSSGVADVVALNAGVMRITLSARMAIDYNTGFQCIPEFTLAGTLDDPDVLAAITDPRLQVIMITAYDGTGFSDCVTNNYIHPTFYSKDNTARMVGEYSEFVYRLHRLLNGSHKKVILSNWEGDNALYCGSAYSYLNDVKFRQGCDEMYPAAYAGNAGPRESVEGMVLWLRAKYLGMNLGNIRAAEEGLTETQVFQAPEISVVHALKDRGYASVLYDVLPRTPFDYVSYSCYEILNNPDPGAALREDLNLIQLATGSRRIVLGEVGYPRSAMGERLIPATLSVVAEAISWGVEYIIQWNLYDQGPGTDFGMYDSDGRLTVLGEYYRQLFSVERAKMSEIFLGS